MLRPMDAGVIPSCPPSSARVQPPTWIAELLDIVADMLEQGEAATGSGHSEDAAIGKGVA